MKPRRYLAAGCSLLAAGCAQLPDAGDPAQNAGRVQIESARGPLSMQRVAAIGAATDHINLEAYIIEDDEIGRQFSELLLQKRGEGVHVNLVYDSVGSIATPKAFFERLRAGGVQVLEFNPVNPLSARKGWLVNNRDHRKLLVIDGRTAFVGGINFSRVHSGGSFARRKAADAKAAWRDTHLRIEGLVVDEFQKLFMQTWAKQRGAPLAAASTSGWCCPGVRTRASPSTPGARTIRPCCAPA